MTAPKKSTEAPAVPAVNPDADPLMVAPPAPGQENVPAVTTDVAKPALGVTPEVAFELTKAPTPVNPPISIGAPGEPTPDQRRAAMKRAGADGVLDRDPASDPMIQALETERDGYLRRGDKDRAAEVDKDIKARGDAARKAAPAGRTATPRDTA